MDFRLNEDRQMLADTLGRFLQDNYGIEKRHEFARMEDGFSREMWGKFAELGVIGALFGEDCGGFGGTGADIALVFEALGKVLAVEPFLPSLLAGSLIAQLGSETQKESVSGIISGETLAAFAHYEPQGRYEPEIVATQARKGSQGHVLTGTKHVVLGGGSASTLVVSARSSGGEDSADGISLFLVDAAQPGVNVQAHPNVDGHAAATLRLDGATGELLGEEGKAFPAIEHALARGTLAVCAESLGAMERAKDLTVEYMHTRKQFGVPIGFFQALQHRMADVLIEIEQMRSGVINAAGRMERPRKERERHVSSAKHLAGRIGRQVAEEAIQIHGGMGMTWEYPVGHYAKRIVMIDHLFGDTDHHLERYIALA
jgi:alkylation response protein AidB-like acyl-CoA dehydrogenase